MASIGKRGRGKSGKAPNFKQKVGKPATTSTAAKGPAWKPAKSSVTGNYGKAVSVAAKAKSTAAPASSSAAVKPPAVPPAPAKLAAVKKPALIGGTPGPTRTPSRKRS